MTIKGLLFDKDGTLIDFNHTWLPAYTQAAELLASLGTHGLTANALLAAGGYNEANGGWKADSVLASGSNAQILDHWQSVTGLTMDQHLQDTLYALFNGGAISYQCVIPHPSHFLAELKACGHAIGVATMDDEAHARQAMEALGIVDQIDFLCGADSGFGVKPDPGMIHAFCHACDLLPSDVAMIGDSPRDLLMAHNAGSPYAIGVLTGASMRDALTPHASHILPSIRELPELLDTIE